MSKNEFNKPTNEVKWLFTYNQLSLTGEILFRIIQLFLKLITPITCVIEWIT
jgi:hypothetical protein